MALVFDIETVGDDFEKFDETTKELLTRSLRRESLEDEIFESKLHDLKDGLGFSPLTGFIVAIGVYDTEKDKGVVYYQAKDKNEEDSEGDNFIFRPMSERDMLNSFWEGAKKYDTFVSFNGRGFDVPFLVVRSAVHSIRPSKDLLSNRYISSQKYEAKHIDLLDQLTFYGAVYRQKGTLHMWTRAFGIESPKASGVDGDDVKGLFESGKCFDIAKYNSRDLIATAKLYEKWDKFIKF